MKKFLLISFALTAVTTMFAQPKLTKDNIDEVIAAMTNEEKATLLVGGGRSVVIDGIPTGAATLVPGAAGMTRPIERLGIPATVLPDGPAGIRISPTREGDSQTYYATGFPVGTLLASSWDGTVVTAVTTAIGNEVLEYGADVLLAPGMNIHRNPLCGRNFEYFSEDPLLSGKMAAAYVRGVQSNGVGTSIKHFAANHQETNRKENNSVISQRALREIFLKNFEIAVKEGRPWTVMSSYNKINGEYTQQSKDLLTTILRDEWGFDGIVMTDWGNKDNTVKSAKAGNDLMEPGEQNEINRLLAAIEDGTISEEEVDRNVRRMLEYIVKTPRFAGYEFSNKPDLKAHAEIALKAAEEAIVLLRNENEALPMEGNEKVALFGVSSIDFVAGGTGSGNVNKAYVVTLKDALEKAGFKLDPKLTGFYDKYFEYSFAKAYLWGDIKSNMLGTAMGKLAEVAIPNSAIISEAADNDAAIIVIGRNAGEGRDRESANDFELTSIERELIQNVSAAFHSVGKKVIVVLNIGGVIETNSWKNLVDAIVLPWSPGQEGANALANILTGKVNPSGKLPMTFPINLMDHPSSMNYPMNMSARAKGSKKDYDYTKYEEGIYVGYRYFTTAGKEVSYPFGYGLSYTTFEYGKPVVKAVGDGFEATIEVKNTGNVAGKEVVELYVNAPAGGLDKPAVELKAFAKTKLLQPGETEKLTFTVDDYTLASFNEASSAWEAAAGVYTLYFSENVSSPKASATYKLSKAKSWEVHNVLAPDMELNTIAVK